MPTEAADSSALADGAARQVAAYVHIPFCARVCPYCDFAVVAGTDQAERYVDAVCTEIAAARPFDVPLAAVAVGGGTPTAIAPESLGTVLSTLEERFGLLSTAEVSIEANPEDLSLESATALRHAGFTRVSLGVQSFDDEVLSSLGRGHSSAEASESVRIARDVFDSVNVDLIFGTPGETLDSWRTSVATALATGIDHLSTYSLTVERGTPLSRAVARGAPAPDPDLQADQWLEAARMASAAGLARYETSNHARPGHAAVYNLVTWAQGEYAAFGNAAHRHRDGERSWNVRRIDRYVERVERGAEAVSGHEVIAGWDREVERVMLGLRRAAGVVPGPAGRALLESERGLELVGAGVLSVAEGRLRVDRPLVADEVSRTLLALDPIDC